MSVMYIVLPLALIFAGVFVGAFIWAVRQGQLDDLETPAARMHFDDDAPPARTASRDGDTGDDATPESASPGPRASGQGQG